MDRQSFILSSAVVTCIIGVGCSSVGPFLLYLLGLVVSAFLGVVVYLGLRFKFSSRFRSDKKFPQCATGTKGTFKNDVTQRGGPGSLFMTQVYKA